MHRFLLFSAVLGTVFAAEPQFLELLNKDAPAPRLDVFVFNATTTPTTTTAKPSLAQQESRALKEAQGREEALKRELAETRGSLEALKVGNAAAVLPVLPVGAGTVIAKGTPAAVITPVATVQQQQQDPQMTARLIGPHGLLSILNPPIMDQQDAAAKLIPSLTLPQVQRQFNGMNQLGQVPQPQNNNFQPNNQMGADPRQMNFNQGGQYPQQAGFGGQQQPLQQFGQYPGQQNTGYLPQQSIQQPSYAANPFGGGSFGQPMQQSGIYPQQQQVPQAGAFNNLLG